MGYTERFDENSLHLFTADMDFQVLSAVLDALHKTVDNKIFVYCAFTIK
ncbi:MAG: hypothetical protein ACK5NF_01995 [Bacilli bacterium]